MREKVRPKKTIRCLAVICISHLNACKLHQQGLVKTERCINRKLILPFYRTGELQENDVRRKIGDVKAKFSTTKYRSETIGVLR